MEQCPTRGQTRSSGPVDATRRALTVLITAAATVGAAIAWPDTPLIRIASIRHGPEIAGCASRLAAAAASPRLLRLRPSERLGGLPSALLLPAAGRTVAEAVGSRAQRQSVLRSRFTPPLVADLRVPANSARQRLVMTEPSFSAARLASAVTALYASEAGGKAARAALS